LLREYSPKGFTYITYFKTAYKPLIKKEFTASIRFRETQHFVLHVVQPVHY